MTGLLLLRVDADARMGGGHLMRCLALVEAWREAGGRVTVLTRTDSPELLARAAEAGAEVVAQPEPAGSPQDAAATAEWARRAGADWVVVDGYHFKGEFLAAVRAGGVPLLALDDELLLSRDQADILLNPNGYADSAGYAGGSGRVLAGRKYALLRREFAEAARRHGPARRSEGLLAVFGAGDAANVTGSCLDWLEGFFPREVPCRVVVGAANPHQEFLRNRCAALGAGRRIELLVNPPDLPDRLAGAALGLSAAGSTAWEFAAMGVASALVEVASNQRSVGAFLGEKGAALELGRPEQAFTAAGGRRLMELWSQPARLAAFGQAGRALVDFHGPARVVEAMHSHPVELRSAVPGDCRLFWEWANDPATRAASYRREPIPWDDHCAWFAARLAQATAQPMLVACSGEPAQPVGLARFAVHDRSAEISLLVAPEARGRGLAAKIIRAATAWALDRGDCDEVTGWVKAGNEPSLRAFRRAGFREESPVDHLGSPSIRFRRRLAPSTS